MLEKLCKDIITIISKLVSVKDLCFLMRTNKLMYKLFSSDRIWRSKIEKFPLIKLNDFDIYRKIVEKSKRNIILYVPKLPPYQPRYIATYFGRVQLENCCGYFLFFKFYRGSDIYLDIPKYKTLPQIIIERCTELHKTPEKIDFIYNKNRSNYDILLSLLFTGLFFALYLKLK